MAQKKLDSKKDIYGEKRSSIVHLPINLYGIRNSWSLDSLVVRY